MKLCRWLCRLGLVLAAGPLIPPGTGLAAKNPAWIEGRSAHFHVIANAKAKRAREVTQKLEEFRHLLGNMFPGLRLDPPITTTVLLFKNEKTLRPYLPLTPEGKPKELRGFMQPGEERMYLVVDLGASDVDRVAFHEYLHLVLHLNSEQPPLWLDEGLAMFYERSEINGAKFTLGFPLADSWAVMQENRLIPLSVLLRVDEKSEYYNEPKKQTLFYAQSWLLVHYLMAAEEGRQRERLVEFLQLLRRRREPEAAFQEAFQTDYAGMEKQLSRYLDQVSVTVFKGQLRAALPQTPVEFNSLETPVAEAYLSDLWINSGRLDEATQALEKLAQAGTAPVEVLYRLGRIALERHDPERAHGHLQQAVARQPDDIGLRYYAALALSLGSLRGGEPQERQQAAAQVVAYLAPILEAKTEFPGAYELLIQARMARGDAPAELIPAVERARTLMPERARFDLLLATLYLNSNRREEAEPLLHTIVRTSTSPQDLQVAQEMLAQLERLRRFEAGQAQLQAAAAEEEHERAGERPVRVVEPIEPPPAPAPAAPPQTRHLRGVLVDVACSDDTAVLTIRERAKERVIRLQVPSRANLLVLGTHKLACGTANAPVAVNYRVEPKGPDIAGVVITLAFSSRR